MWNLVLLLFPRIPHHGHTLVAEKHINAIVQLNWWGLRKYLAGGFQTHPLRNKHPSTCNLHRMLLVGENPSFSCSSGWTGKERLKYELKGAESVCKPSLAWVGCCRRTCLYHTYTDHVMHKHSYLQLLWCAFTVFIDVVFICDYNNVPTFRHYCTIVPRSLFFAFCTPEYCRLPK